MSVHAQLADGTVLEFPDGTDTSVIQRVVKQQVNASSPGGDTIDAIKGAAVTTAAAIPGMIGDIRNAGHALTGFLSKKLGIDPQDTTAAYDAILGATGNAAQAAGLPNFNTAPATQDIVGMLPKPVQDAAAYQPQTPRGKYAAAITGFLPMLIPGEGELQGGAKLTGFLARRGAETALTGAASEAAGEVADNAGASPGLQTAARIAAAVATPFGVAGVGKAARAVGEMGAPFAAAVNPEIAEQQAGKILAQQASDPAAAAASLAQDGAIVPGSQPTTFQQSGDMGLGALERAQATKNPEQFNARRAEQNAARVQSLTSLQPDANPNDVSKFLKGQFEDLDQHTQAQVDMATAAAQERTAALGGNAAPEASGEAVRAALVDSEDAAKAKNRALRDAIDPSGDQVGNVQQTQQAAQDIQSSVGRYAKPMEGDEAAAFQAASELPPLAPLSDLLDVKARVGQVMRDELRANGKSPSYARLSQLNSAIQDNLSNTISHQIAVEAPAVARGELEGDKSLASRVQGWVDEFRVQREARTGGGASDQPVPQGGSAGGAVGDGAELPAPGGPGSSPGDQGVSGPTVTPETSQRLKDYNRAYAGMKQTFGQGPVGEAVRRAGTNDSFRLPDGRVPGKFFHPGSTGYSDMQALLKASPEAAPVIAEYAASSLRKAAVEDGVLNPTKFERWRNAHADSLRALPDEIRSQYENAAAAGRAVEDATAARVQVLKEAQAGAIGKLMGLDAPEDVVRQVGRILNGQSPVKDMADLARATAGNPEARAGLRRAVADYISTNMVSNVEAGTSGVAQIAANSFQTFFKKRQAALRTIFTPDEVDLMGAVSRDIQRSKRSENAVKLAGGSNTAQDLIGASKGKKPWVGSLLDALAAGAGLHAGGPIGAATGWITAHLAQSLRAAGITKIDELVTQALLNPSVARRLLLKAPATPPPAMQAALARAISTAQIAAIEAHERTEPPQ